MNYTELFHFKRRSNSVNSLLLLFFLIGLSRWSFYVERRNINSRFHGRRVIKLHNSRISVQSRRAVFFAYFRPDLLRILCLMCCPAHLKGKVMKMLERKGIKPVCGKSKKEMTHGCDVAFVFVSGGMRPSIKRHMKETYLR